MTRLPGGQLPVFRGTAELHGTQDGGGVPHPLRAWPAHKGPLGSLPSQARRKAAQFRGGRGAALGARQARLAEMQGKRRPCKTEHGPRQSSTQTRGQGGSARLLARRSAAGDWGGGGALGLSAVRQARGIQAWPREAPSAQASSVLCEMGMIHVSTLSRLSAAHHAGALAVSLTRPVDLCGCPASLGTWIAQGLDSP